MKSIITSFFFFYLSFNLFATDIELSDSCVDFGSIMENTFIIDSLYISNNGTDTLFISSLNTSNSEFIVDTAGFYILPGDSSLVILNFIPLTPGNFNDTLNILNSEIDTLICLSGTAFGVPIFAYSPDSVMVNMTECDDSITFPITIYNTGLSDLNVNIKPDFFDGFEAGNYDNWTVNNNFNTYTISSIDPASGTNCLSIDGSGYTGLSYGFDEDTIDYFSVKLKTDGYGSNCNYIIGGNNSNDKIFTIHKFSETIYSVHGNGFINVPYSNSWIHFELKNINYINQTFDIYVDGILMYNGMGFDNSGSNLQGMSRVDLFNYSTTSTGYYDDIQIGRSVIPSWMSLSSDSLNVNVNDSSMLDITFYSQGLNSGTLYSDLIFNSNNPLIPISIIPVNFMLDGTPEIMLPTSCITFDTIYENAVSSDSIWINNNGCDTLFISNITTDTSVFSYNTYDPFILPFDSIPIEVLFSPLTIGDFQSNLNIFNNDIDTVICLNATSIGAPIINFYPNVLDIDLFSCDDSISIPITVFNSGLNQLNVSNEIQSSNFILNDGFESGSYNNWTPINNSNFYNVINYYAATGNSCLMMGASSFSGLKNNFPEDKMDYFSINLNGSMYSGETVKIGSDISSGGITYIKKSGSNYLIWGNTIYYHLINSDWTEIELKNIDYTAKTYDIYVNDTLRSTGMGFASSSITGMSQISLHNYNSNQSSYFDDVKVGKLNPSWIDLSIDTLNINVNDSITYDVNFYSEGMTSGDYYADIIMNSNDPLNSVDTIPVYFSLNGFPEITLSDTCLNFGSNQQFTNSNDSILVSNLGCDTLFISNITADTSAFIVTPFDSYVLPFDSSYISVSFDPYTAGTFNSNLNIFNNDIDTIICLSGTSIGAPTMNYYSDTIIVNLIECNDSITVPISVFNTGLNNLNLSQEIQITNIKLFDSFENGNYNNWTVIDNSNTYAINGNALDSSSNNLSIQGVSNLGLEYNFTQDTLNYFSIELYSDYDFNVSSFVELGNDMDADGICVIFKSGSQYIVQGNWSNYTPITNTWTHVEIKNINYNQKTFDIYVNDVLTYTGMGFKNSSITGVSKVKLYSYNNTATSYYDDILIGDFRKPSWANLSADTLDVNINDTISFDATFYSYGIKSGDYYSEIIIESNDPQSPVDTIPVFYTLTGFPEIALSDTCLDFGNIQQHTTSIDSFLIYNIGCDTLFISNLIPDSSTYLVLSYETYVLPFDSSIVIVSFSPLTVGDFNTNLNIYNSDIDTIICLSGSSIGVPIMNYYADTINVNLIECNDSITVPISVFNTGLNNLNLSQEIQTTNISFFDGFENGNYNNWTVIDNSNTYNTNANYLALGSYSLSIQGISNSGLEYNFTQDTLNYFSVKLYSDSDYYGSNYVELGNNTIPNGICTIFKNGSQYIVQGYWGTYINISNTWTHIEIKNINYVSKTFDIYVDNELFQSGRGFSNSSIDGMSKVKLYSKSNYATSYYDEILIGDSYKPSWANLSADTLSVNINDTLSFDATFYSNGIESGDYYTEIILESNDPLSPSDTIPVYFSFDGIPELALSDTCLDYGSIQQNSTSIDSFLIYNIGCDTLFISNLSSDSSTYMVSPYNTFILPFDSSNVIVTFSPLTVGDFSANLNIYNSDIDTLICLSGSAIGAPIMNFYPDSLFVNLNSCDDSITIPITVYNTGLNPLNIIQGINSTSNPSYSFFDGFENGNYNNWSSTTSTNISAVVSNTSATGNNCLYMEGDSGLEYTFPNDTVDYFSIKLKSDEVGYGHHNFVSIGDGNGALRDGICMINKYSNNKYLINGSSNFMYTITSPWTHVELKNINYSSKTFDIYMNGTLEYLGMGFNYNILTGMSGVYLDNLSNYTGYYDDVQIGDAINPNWISLNSDSLNINVNDSTTFDITISAEGTFTRDYYSEVIIGSNDPLSPFDTIPVFFTLDGSADISISDTCLNFDTIYQNTSFLDSFLIYNTGCDTLFVSNLSVDTSTYIISSTSNFILPYDSSLVNVTFSPVTVGNFNAILHINNNVIDTNICLIGTCIGTPVLEYFPESIDVVLNTCNDSIIIPITVINSGESLLNTNIYSNFVEGFESGNYNNWTVTNTSSNINITTSNPASGSNCLSIIGVGGTDLEYDFSPSQANYFSIKLKGGNYSFGSNNYCKIGDAILADGICQIYKSGSSNYKIQGSTTKSFYVSSSNNWTHFELKNIDYQSKTFDLYINGYIISSGMGFKSNSIDEMSKISLSSNQVSYTSYYDDIIIENSYPIWLSNDIDSLSLNVNDTLIYNLTVKSAGLISGNYYSNLIINSNDPFRIFDTIPINFTLNGIPEISFSDACLDFGILQENLTKQDSFKIYNSGCDTLFISNLVPDSIDFSASSINNYILPKDSSYITVSFTPTSIGYFNSNLNIFSNAIDTTFCLIGESTGIPVLNYFPDTINVSLLECDDSIIVPFTIFNTGMGVLSINTNQFHTEGFESGNLNNIDIIDNTNTYSFTSNNPASGNNCLSILGAANFGLEYNIQADTFNYFSIKLRSDDTNGSSNQCRIGDVAAVNQQICRIFHYGTNQYIVQGINNYFHTVTGPGWTHFELKNINYNLKTFDIYIDGVLVNSGMGFSSNLVTQMSKISIFNGDNNNAGYYDDIKIGTATPNWLNYDIDTMNLAVNDSIIHYITFNSTDITSGLFQYFIPLLSNDPLSPFPSIPINFNFIGEPEISFADSCLDLGIHEQFSEIVDSFLVYNTGCDTLHISNITVNQTLFDINYMADFVLPFDSAFITYMITPLTLGNQSSILELETNDVDTNICISILSIDPPIINSSVNNESFKSCLETIVFPITISNSGLGILNWELVPPFDFLFGLQILSISQNGGVLNQGDSTIIEISLMMNGLSSGQYYDSIGILSNDPLSNGFSDNLTLNINNWPCANFLNSENENCNDQIDFINTTENPGNIWIWNFGDGSYSTDFSPSHTYRESGLYWVTLMSMDSLGNESEIEKLIELNFELPSAVIHTFNPLIEEDTIQFGSNEYLGTYWEWSFGDLDSAFIQLPEHVYTAYGIFDVSLYLIDKNGCGAFGERSITIEEKEEIIVIIPINDKGLYVFPNPSNGIFTIFNPKKILVTEIQITNSIGEEVYSFSNQQGLFSEKQIHLNVSSGLYFMKIAFADESIVLKKIVVYDK